MRRVNRNFPNIIWLIDEALLQSRHSLSNSSFRIILRITNISHRCVANKLQKLRCSQTINKINCGTNFNDSPDTSKNSAIFGFDCSKVKTESNVNQTRLEKKNLKHVLYTLSEIFRRFFYLYRTLILCLRRCTCFLERRRIKSSTSLDHKKATLSSVSTRISVPPATIIVSVMFCLR